MAVPKQRQSRARTKKRRSSHTITPPRLHSCPRCGAARLPHRVCRSCGTYAGREIIAPAAPDTDDE